MIAVDPYSVKCPRCDQPAGKPCVVLSSVRREESRLPHPARTDAARAAQEPSS